MGASSGTTRPRGGASDSSRNDEPLRLEYRLPEELESNPLNWRTHSPAQETSLREALADVGWAGALLLNERTGRLIDGHLRKRITPGQPVPVLIGSWSEEQERKILATLDPIGAMAGIDSEKLVDLLGSVEIEADVEKRLREMIATGPPAESDPDAEAAPILHYVGPLPSMTWVLLGVSTVSFGQIAEAVEAVAAMPGVICEIAKTGEPRK